MPSKTFWNRHNLPDPVAAVLAYDGYNRGNSHISVTGLIQPPRIRILKTLGTEEDVIDRLWSSVGTAFHAFAEEALQPYTDEYIVEERYYHTINGWVVTGQIDILVPLPDDTYCIYDWKVTTTSKIEKGVPAEWEAQLNSYAHIVRQNTGRRVSQAKIVAITRDHGRNPFNPEQKPPIQILDVRLWADQQQEEYLTQRVREHQKAEEAHAFGDPLPYCTDQEQWRTPDRFAVMSPDATRAHRVFDTQEEAEQKAAQIRGGWVEIRTGTARRCEGNYCGVNKNCDQRRKEVSEALINIVQANKTKLKRKK